MRALLSVANKTGIQDFAKFLISCGVEIYSTGGTYETIKLQNSINKIEDLTGWPEMLDGRVKTLHPKIYAGILADPNNPNHTNELEKHKIPQFDIIVTNLYTFSDALKSDDDKLITENIDIGGHTLIRAATKNKLLVVTDPEDYNLIITNWNNLKLIKEHLIKKAWRYIASYDMAIATYYDDSKLYKSYTKLQNFKYGTNPQQQASLYLPDSSITSPFEVLNGNLGYINTLDALYSFSLVCELGDLLNLPAFASYKHNSPAGVGLGIALNNNLKKTYFVHEQLGPVACAFVRSRQADPLSSFGDFIASNTKLDTQTANLISSEVSDGIIAPSYEPEALEILKKKKQGQFVILLGNPKALNSNQELKELHGIALVQDQNNAITKYNNLINLVTKNKDLSEQAKRDLILANTVVKYTQSNSVCACLDGQVIGIGAGQQNRVDCVRLVRHKTQVWTLRQTHHIQNFCDNLPEKTKKQDKINAIFDYLNENWNNKIIQNELDNFRLSCCASHNLCLASDAFFPFTDSIEVANSFGIKNIIQPGGSVRDPDIINLCDEYNIAMVFTGNTMRMFLH